MEVVYAFVNDNRVFGAFWERDGKAYMFLPHLKRSAIEMDWQHWYGTGAENSEELNDKKYSRLINFACMYFSMSGIYFERSSVCQMTTPMGCYYPRVWRGVPSLGVLAGYRAIPPSLTEFSAGKQAVVAATSLFGGLVDLFRYVEPNKLNDNVYGHRIRELLILACTEVESHWKSVLLLNMKVVPNNFHPKTRDYVKLCPVLKLKEWSVTLNDYFGSDLISPFDSWDESKSTQSLTWYDAYNLVKHDREGKF
ncbi:hypothetical protein [Pseudomonas sp. A-RE-19]|uniref:hypothetical protein n=1 Tax=Pseudomonas sp. A-RE-19 TaxID=2832401 RepID=UPI001CBF5E35|nr:hypothetical protein [Pseudomonas sp. A-RE-19]